MNNTDPKNDQQFTDDMFQRVSQEFLQNSEISSVGKITSNRKNIMNRLLHNYYAVAAFIVLIIILLMTFIIPLASQYGANERIVDNNIFNWAAPVWIDGGNTQVFLAQGINDPLLHELVSAGIFKDLTSAQGAVTSQTINGADVSFITFSQLGSASAPSGIVLGLDGQGRDIWTRLWTGAAFSFLLAFSVAIVETTLGVIAGTYLGFKAGSKTDVIVMRIIEMIKTVPELIWFIILLFILPKGNFWPLYFALILIGWVDPVYAARLQTLKIKDSEFIQSAQSIGISIHKQVFKHAIPMIIGKMFVVFVNRVPKVILAEASLAFLGITTDPNFASLGNVFNDAKGAFDYWWYILFPSLLLLLFTISLQIIASGMHDAFDPRLAR